MNETGTSEPVSSAVVPPETPGATQGNGASPQDKPEPKTPEFMSEKFAVLARKEKSIVKARQEIAALKADFERERKDWNENLEEFKRWKKIKENAKLDPDAYLNEAGLSYGYLTEKALKGEKIDGNEILARAEAKIAALEKKLEERDAKLKEDQTQQASQDVINRRETFFSNVNDWISAQGDAYELINMHNQHQIVRAVIEEAANRKKDITVKEAADKVEAYLAEQIEKAVSSSKKFKEKYVPKKIEEKKEPGAPTLNNSMNTTTPVSPGMITDQERTARALAALEKALGES